MYTYAGVRPLEELAVQMFVQQCYESFFSEQGGTEVGPIEGYDSLEERERTKVRRRKSLYI